MSSGKTIHCRSLEINTDGDRITSRNSNFRIIIHSDADCGGKQCAFEKPKEQLFYFFAWTTTTFASTCRLTLSLCVACLAKPSFYYNFINPLPGLLIVAWRLSYDLCKHICRCLYFCFCFCFYFRFNWSNMLNRILKLR